MISSIIIEHVRWSEDSCKYGKYFISNVNGKKQENKWKTKYYIFKTTKDNSQTNDENVFFQSSVFYLLSNQPGSWITTSLLHNKETYQLKPLKS